MEKYFDKILSTDINNDKQTEEIVKALNSKTRRDVLRLLATGSMSIWDIADKLNVPLSTMSEHISVLVKAGIVSVVKKTSERGNSKIISRQYEKIEINTVPHRPYSLKDSVKIINIPIGSYYSFKVNQYCGMVGEGGYIGARDDPDAFYSLERHEARLIWFDFGYLEYKIPIKNQKADNIKSITLTLEVCSEAPGYNEDWKSDIYFEINGKRICTYTSPGDFGSRPGRFTPKWWTAGTKYGIQKKLEVNAQGSFIDGEKTSNITVNDLNASNNVLTLRIGVDENAKNRGGINIFGKDFGDTSDDMILTVTYN